MKGMKSSQQNKAEKTMESSSLASTIEKDLQKEGYKKVDVEKADAEATTVTIISGGNDDGVTDVTVSAVVATQSFAGVTVAQASEPSFQKTVLAAVADKLDVKEGDVTITSTAASLNGKDVVVEYTVTGDNSCLIFILVPPVC